MSLFRTQELLNVHFPHFLLSAFPPLSDALGKGRKIFQEILKYFLAKYLHIWNSTFVVYLRGIRDTASRVRMWHFAPRVPPHPRPRTMRNPKSLKIKH